MFHWAQTAPVSVNQSWSHRLITDVLKLLIREAFFTQLKPLLSLCVCVIDRGSLMCLSGHVTCVFPLSPSCGPGCGSVTDTNCFGSSLSSSWSVHEQDARSPDLWLLYLFVLVFISLTITQLTDLLIMSVDDLLIVINFEKTILF